MVEEGAKNIYVPPKACFHCRCKWHQLAQLIITVFGTFPSAALCSAGLVLSCLEAGGVLTGNGLGQGIIQTGPAPASESGTISAVPIMGKLFKAQKRLWVKTKRAHGVCKYSPHQEKGHLIWKWVCANSV